jgi:hypothetical protein
MFAELGRRADAALAAGTGAAHEAVHATLLYLQRIAGVVSGAVTRVTHETQDLAWNYRDVADDLRRPDGEAKQLHQGELAQETGRPVLRVVNSDD